MPASFYDCSPAFQIYQACFNELGFDDPSLSTVSAALTVGYFETFGEVFGTVNAALYVGDAVYPGDASFAITTSPVLTPEPSTGILLLTGVGLLIVTMRKRIAQSPRQDS